MIKMHSYINFAIIVAMFILNALASTHLVAYFMATNLYLFHICLHASLGPTKSRPHFMNGSFRKVVTSLAKLYVANLPMH